MVQIVKQKHWGSLKILQKWETANPNWRPRKWVALCNDLLEKAWYTPVTKQEIETNYLSLMNVDEETLKEMANDKAQPMLIRILIKNMLGTKWFEIIETMLDRWIGRPKQQTDITSWWERIWWGMSDEDRALLDKVLAENL